MWEMPVKASSGTNGWGQVQIADALCKSIDAMVSLESTRRDFITHMAATGVAWAVFLAGGNSGDDVLWSAIGGPPLANVLGAKRSIRAPSASLFSPFSGVYAKTG